MEAQFVTFFVSQLMR